MSDLKVLAPDPYQEIIQQASEGNCEALEELFQFEIVGIVGLAVAKDIRKVGLVASSSEVARHAVEIITERRRERGRRQTTARTVATYELWGYLHGLERVAGDRADCTPRKESREWRKAWNHAIKVLRKPNPKPKKLAAEYAQLVDAMTTRLTYSPDDQELGPPKAQREALRTFCALLHWPVGPSIASDLAHQMEKAAPGPCKRGPEPETSAGGGLVAMVKLEELREAGFSDRDLRNLILTSDQDWDPPPCPAMVRTYRGNREALWMWLRQARHKMKRNT